MKNKQVGVVVVVVVLGMAVMMGGMWLVGSFMQAKPSAPESRAAVDSIAASSVTAAAVILNPNHSEGGISNK